MGLPDGVETGCWLDGPVCGNVAFATPAVAVVAEGPVICPLVLGPKEMGVVLGGGGKGCPVTPIPWLHAIRPD